MQNVTRAAVVALFGAMLIGRSGAQPATTEGGTASPDALPASDAPPAQPAPAAGAGAPGTQVQAVREGDDQAVGSYALQLRNLEQQINQLKQEVFRSKARLALLAENVIQGAGSGRAKIRLVHRNQMGGTFQLVKIAYFLDRSPVYNQADESGEMGEMEEVHLYESIIAPGDHTVSVELEYRGRGHGLFSYLQGFRFRVNSSHTFTIAGGKEIAIEGIGFEQGGPLTAIEERPSVRFTEQVRDLAAGASAAAGGQGR